MSEAALTQGRPATKDWPGPVGRPYRPHWWSIQPAPPVPPVSARRAYAEVLCVFAAFFAASIIAGAESLGKIYPAPGGSWAVFTPAAVSELARAAIAVVVVVLLAGRRGMTPRLLGLGLPRRADGGVAAGFTFRMAVWAMMTLLVGGLVTAATATGRLNLPARQDGGFLMYAAAASAAAGIVEETVVLAFVVSTLRQARRPLPEIVAVAVLLRCSYHDYYGPGVIGIAIWAAVFVWLYLRAGSVLPLIVVHFIWDSTIFFGNQPGLKHALAAATFAAFVLLPLAAGISWLAGIGNRPGRLPGPAPYRRPVGGPPINLWGDDGGPPRLPE